MHDIHIRFDPCIPLEPQGPHCYTGRRWPRHRTTARLARRAPASWITQTTLCRRHCRPWRAGDVSSRWPHRSSHGEDRVHRTAASRSDSVCADTDALVDTAQALARITLVESYCTRCGVPSTSGLQYSSLRIPRESKPCACTVMITGFPGRRSPSSKLKLSSGVWVRVVHPLPHRRARALWSPTLPRGSLRASYRRRSSPARPEARVDVWALGRHGGGATSRHNPLLFTPKSAARCRL